MNPKVLKLLAITGGVVLLWVLVLLVFGESRNPAPVATIEFWNVFDKSDDIEPLLDEFREQANVKVNYKSFTDLEEYRETLLLELASGEGPDVLAINNTWIPKYRSLLRPLPSKDLGFSTENVKKTFVDAVTESVVFEEEISEADEKAGREPEEEILALPMYVDTLALYYNQSLFRNVLSKPYSMPELTWDGVRDDSIKLTSQSETSDDLRLSGIALGRADNISRALDIFYTLYRQLGGEDLRVAGSENVRGLDGKDYQPIKKALDFYTSFARKIRKEYSWSAESTLGAPEKELDTFVRGDLAMLIGYSYYHTSLRNLIQQYEKKGANVIKVSDIGISPLPQVTDPSAGNPKLVLADFFALAVPKSSKEPHAAWQLILYLTGRNAQQQYFEATQKPTSRRDLIEEQRKDPLFGIFAEQAIYATSLPISDDELYAEVINPSIDAVAGGDMNVSEAAQKITSEIRASAKEDENK